MRKERRLVLVLALVLQLGLSGAATADWSLYLAGELGIASGSVDGRGFANDAAPVIPVRLVGASYSDSSPLMSGAFGITSPIDELTAWELPYDLRLPAWPLSLEVEATGLRSFEGIEVVPGSNVRSAGSTETWSVMFDLWQDVPLEGLSRPLASLFGRLPRFVTHTLERTAMRAGGGVGVSGWTSLFVDTAHVSTSDSNNFAWQVGAGLGYDLTDVVGLGLGYRYFDYGEVDSALFTDAGVPRGVYMVAQTSHEFRARLTVRVYSFRSPWRR